MANFVSFFVMCAIVEFTSNDYFVVSRMNLRISHRFKLAPGMSWHRVCMCYARGNLAKTPFWKISKAP
jgi:hypothetical protein